MGYSYHEGYQYLSLRYLLENMVLYVVRVGSTRTHTFSIDQTFTIYAYII